MFSIDIVISFAFMALLFLRQISIIKHENKINYAPLMIGIGAISSVIHFIIHPEYKDIILLLRESSFPLLVSLILYIVMNIIHQTIESKQKRLQHEFTQTLIEQITQLKQYTTELEVKINDSQKTDLKAQEELRKKFKEDIQALDTIKSNQNIFLEMFDEMKALNKGVEKAFRDFADVEMPSLDDVVHKHIDLIRISEQDHFNKLNSLLQNIVQNKGDISKDLDDVKATMVQIQNLAKNISDAIVTNTVSKMANISKAFEEQISTLKSHSESLNTALYESENKISHISKESEVLLTQMSLSSKKMDEMQEQSSNLSDMYVKLRALMNDIETLRADYVKAQSQLSMLSRELRESQEDDINNIKEQMEDLIVLLTGKIDNSLEKLHKHYHISNEELSQSVQMLAKKAQLQKGYGETNV
ncbi:hypothetical protein FJR48_05310 [Sulfurimonas lithotrophica]|uniref:Uncharacterized protein n=1 Tax=Sulfurimonas lithotrophica TaxID=2590022 RepID=A0A5P8P0D8_9BACT|nr:hypothetical protein [Sulfurimonas lithotrophica]QFR49173.1 hypothetical protein FJR48_05310 [Sulfurimonas lithotrophica]